MGMRILDSNIDNSITENEKSNSNRQTRNRGVRFPYVDLKQSVENVKQIDQKVGGKGTAEVIADVLSSTVTSSKFKATISSAKQFNLVSREDDFILQTELAKKIIYPTRSETELENKRQAFFSCQLFLDVYNRLKGKLLPTEELLGNILVSEFNISTAKQSREKAVHSFIESAIYADLLIEEEEGQFKCIDLEIPNSTYNDIKDIDIEEPEENVDFSAISPEEAVSEIGT